MKSNDAPQAEERGEVTWSSLVIQYSKGLLLMAAMFHVSALTFSGGSGDDVVCDPDWGNEEAGRKKTDTFCKCIFIFPPAIASNDHSASL